MAKYVRIADLEIDARLADLVADEIAPGTGIPHDRFWMSYADILAEVAPVTRKLLAERDGRQQQIDRWWQARERGQVDIAAQRRFLEEIGYIVPAPAGVSISTSGVDPEVATVAGPQLVVPVSNARFALNAVNARWGSLYDALYGSDALGLGAPPPGAYDARRGDAVIARAARFLDEALPLARCSHSEAVGYEVADGSLRARMPDGDALPLADSDQFVGSSRAGNATSYFLRHHGLHVEIVVEPGDAIGRQSSAGVKDVVLEAALTTIMDCEDSVAAVDAADKAVVYRNWLGLMKGTLSASFEKAGTTVARSMRPDRLLAAADGGELTLPGRSLMMVRHVGHLMTTDAVLDADGRETPEGLLDAMVTAFAALHDLHKQNGPRNSRTGSMYVVKPKMHGPAEAALANRMLGRVEDALGMTRNTIKLGVMDEERRTTVNLAAVIAEVRERVAFINTGFLDRTGDEIHTSMHAGPMLPKGEIKSTTWLAAYEDNNVDVGLRAGFAGRAQIGKGMWAKPDAMAEMLATKAAHPNAGANTAWVPSPTAATLHALHYHEVDVTARQQALSSRAPASLDAILTPPLLGERVLGEDEVRREVDNNCQLILGYVVRWVDQGVGCSKVPDIDDVPLMEDRATLRISSQHLANWLLHGVVTRDQIEDSLRRMAVAVDRQNAADPRYRPMAPRYAEGTAFKAASDLIFEALVQPNGYTEPLLHRARRAAKESLG